MNRYYFDWQENGYYDQTENNTEINTSIISNQNSSNITFGRKKGRIKYAFVTLLAVTVFAAGALSVLGAECLVYKMI